MKPDLPAAIARLKADDDSIYVEMVKAHYPAWKAFSPLQTEAMCDSLRDKDRRLVLAALLDARPLTPEGLVSEFGFTKHPDWDEIVIYEGKDFRLDYDSTSKKWHLDVWGDVDMELPPILAPQTHGDLASLFLRLERSNA